MERLGTTASLRLRMIMITVSAMASGRLTVTGRLGPELPVASGQCQPRGARLGLA